jgi:predicted component of type VI protein secretion system
MLEVRSLLTDLKAKVISNREFRKQLETVLNDKAKMASVIAELDKIAPLGGEKKEE